MTTKVVLAWVKAAVDTGSVAHPLGYVCVKITGGVLAVIPGTVLENLTVDNGVIIQLNLDISKFMGLSLTSSNYPKCKLICTSGNLDL